MSIKSNFKDQFFSEGQSFLKKLGSSLAEASIEIPKHWDIDHICYRVDSLDRYKQVCSEVSKLARLLIESEVNGRPIATYKLSHPFEFGNRVIDVVEVPAPKPAKATANGFEHIEVVADLSFEEIEKKFASCHFNRSGLQKNYNAELEICLPNENIKFHQTSLESVTRLEASRVFSVIKKSQVLERLKSFTPLIAGTFPLGLETEKSDVDVILSAGDLSSLEIEIRNSFSGFPSFGIKRYDLNGAETLLTHFTLEGVEFELFAQTTPSIRQAGYLHFLIEERLLKYGGPEFRDQILEFRKGGLKTEPAFAKALDLDGDPYEALLLVQTMSDPEIRAILEQAGFVRSY